METPMDSSSLPFPELREKAIISFGDECLQKSIALIVDYGLPAGLLPLEDVVEGGWVEETGFVWIITKRKQEYHFKEADRHCKYSQQITCYIEKNRMKNLKGVKAKDMLVWVPVNEICIDEANPSKIQFKSFVGLSRTMPVEHFAGGACEKISI